MNAWTHLARLDLAKLSACGYEPHFTHGTVPVLPEGTLFACGMAGMRETIMKPWMATLLTVLLGTSAALAQSGKLQQVREAVDNPAPSTTPNNDAFEPPDDSESFIGQTLGPILLAPFWLPHTALNDDFERDGYFPFYPYADHFNGYMHREPLSDYPNFVPREVAGRLSLDYGDNFDDLQRFSGQVLLETSARFGIEARGNYYREHFPCGCVDDLFVGHFDVFYRFAQHEKVQMYAGLGANMFDDRYKNRWGFNFTYGADYFPCQPLVLSSVMDLGTLGDAGLFHLRGTVGVMLNRWEIFTGYDYLNIGGTALQGPLAGVRLWF